MKNPGLVDPKSYELAEYFLPEAAKENVMNLAIEIQQVIEDWLRERGL